MLDGKFSLIPFSAIFYHFLFFHLHFLTLFFFRLPSLLPIFYLQLFHHTFFHSERSEISFLYKLPQDSSRINEGFVRVGSILTEEGRLKGTVSRAEYC